MADIDLARPLLEDQKWNLIMVKKGRVFFSSGERGAAPAVQAVHMRGNSLHNAAGADRIVGLAVAMVCLHAGTSSVYADIASHRALDMLMNKGVFVTDKSTVPHISNYDGTDLCPFEKLAAGCRTPSKLSAALQSVFSRGDQ